MSYLEKAFDALNEKLGLRTKDRFLNEAKEKDVKELRKSQKEVIDDLVKITQSMRKLKGKVEEFKEKYDTLAPVAMEILKSIDMAGIRVGKALVFVKTSNISSPSFAKVIEVVQDKLTPKIAKLLQETYEKLKIDRGPSVQVKEGVNEGIKEILDGIGAWIHDKFKAGMNAVFGDLDLIDAAIKEVQKA